MIRFLIAIVAVIVGWVVGCLANLGIGMVNVMMFPLPDGMTFTDMLNPDNKQAIVDWIASLPQTAFILVLVAHLSQAFLGGFIAALIAKRNMMCVAMVIGVLTLIAGLINMMTIPAPVWLWIEMPLYLVVAWWAAKIVMKMRGPNTTVAGSM